MDNTNNTGIVAETPEQELARLRAENAALKAAAPVTKKYKVTEKGGVSVYGLGQFPVTLYKSQWDKLLGQAEDIKAFIKAHEAELSVKTPKPTK
jgi:hypothetical protein